MTSSSASLTCRIDWRPSRLLQAALRVLGFLAALSLWLSALPGWLALGFGAISMVAAIRIARAQAGRRSCSLVWQAGASEVALNVGGCVEYWHSPRVSFRGPLASLAATDAAGRSRRLMWWPDTLDARGLRSLRLAASTHALEKKSAPKH